MQRSDALKILKQYKADYSEQYGIVRIGFFGSVARNEANEQSDVDVVVQTKVPNLFNLVHIKEKLEELFHSHVDIVRYREKMNPYLKNRIEKEAVYV